MDSIALGGSAANPPHDGHLLVLWFVLNSSKFSTVIWIPSGSRVDKPETIDPNNRLTMTNLLIPKNFYKQGLYVDYSEIFTKSKPTHKELSECRNKYPKSKVVFFTGSDSVVPQKIFNGLSEIESYWKKGKELINTNILILPRAGFPLPKNYNHNNHEILNLRDILLKNIFRLPVRLYKYLPSILLRNQLPNIQSRNIRQNHKKYKAYLPSLINNFILKNNIYSR